MTDIPGFVLDARGKSVVPGDTIAYSVREGDVAALRVAVVDSFQYAQRTYNTPVLKIKLKPREEGRWGSKPRAALIEERLKRFVRVEAGA